MSKAKPANYTSEWRSNERFSKGKIFINSKSAKSNNVGKKFMKSPSSGADKNQTAKKSNSKTFSGKWLSHENYTKQKKSKKSKPNKQKLKK
jgi:hypothetical protein